MVKGGSGITKLLIAYDGSGYAHGALNELLFSGLPLKAQVIIISVCEIWLPVGHPAPKNPLDSELAEYFQKHREQVERNLAETSTIAYQAREELSRYFPDWNIDVEVVSGSPAFQILLKAEKFQPDIIVVSERGLSSDQDVGLGSTSQTVLSAAKCSVRIVRFKPRISRSRLKFIIGFDGSPGSISVIKMVASRTWMTKPNIRLITVTDPFTLLKTGRVFQPIEGMSEGIMEGEQKWVNYLARSAIHLLHEAGHSATLQFNSGNPRMVLVSEAEKWDADAIFLGATFSVSLPEFYSLGCVALAIANRATCSVEVVRKIK